MDLCIDSLPLQKADKLKICMGTPNLLVFYRVFCPHFRTLVHLYTELIISGYVCSLFVVIVLWYSCNCWLRSDRLQCRTAICSTDIRWDRRFIASIRYSPFSGVVAWGMLLSASSCLCNIIGLRCKLDIPRLLTCRPWQQPPHTACARRHFQLHMNPDLSHDSCSAAEKTCCAFIIESAQRQPGRQGKERQNSMLWK